MSFHMAHLSYSNYIAGVNRVMTTWPLAFSFFFCGGSTDLDLGGLEKTLNAANEEFAQKKKRTGDIFLMISSLLASKIYRGFLIAGLTFSTCLHRYRCKICNLVRRTLENCSCFYADLCLELY